MKHPAKPQERLNPLNDYLFFKVSGLLLFCKCYCYWAYAVLPFLYYALNVSCAITGRGEKGDEEQLIGFLNAVLSRTRTSPIASVEIIENKTFTAEIAGNKASVLDIRAVLQDSTKVNIEVQLRNYGNMDKRSLFYWSKEYTRSLEQGQDYN